MGCVTTLAVLWAPVHLYLTQTDWRALRNWLGRIGVAADRNVLEPSRDGTVENGRGGGERERVLGQRVNGRDRA